MKSLDIIYVILYKLTGNYGKITLTGWQDHDTKLTAYFSAYYMS